MIFVGGAKKANRRIVPTATKWQFTSDTVLWAGMHMKMWPRIFDAARIGILTYIIVSGGNEDGYRNEYYRDPAFTKYLGKGKFGEKPKMPFQMTVVSLR